MGSNLNGIDHDGTLFDPLLAWHQFSKSATGNVAMQAGVNICGIACKEANFVDLGNPLVIFGSFNVGSYSKTHTFVILASPPE